MGCMTMKCKSPECENEVEEDKVVCPSCIDNIFKSLVQEPSSEAAVVSRAVALEVVVHHAIHHSDWRYKCAETIHHNQITEEEVQEAARLRGDTVKGTPLTAEQKQKLENDWIVPSGGACWTTPSTTEKRLTEAYVSLKQLSLSTESDPARIKEKLVTVLEQLEQVLKMVQCDLKDKQRLEQELELEKQSRTQPLQEPIKPTEPRKDPYRIDWQRTSRQII